MQVVVWGDGSAQVKGLELGSLAPIVNSGWKWQLTHNSSLG